MVTSSLGAAEREMLYSATLPVSDVAGNLLMRAMLTLLAIILFVNCVGFVVGFASSLQRDEPLWTLGDFIAWVQNGF